MAGVPQPARSPVAYGRTRSSAAAAGARAAELGSGGLAQDAQDRPSLREGGGEYRVGLHARHGTRLCRAMLTENPMEEPTYNDEFRAFLVTDAAREELVAAFVPVLAGDECVLFATLYGSAVEGKGERLVHDLDVALYLSESARAESWRTEGRLGVALEEKAHEILGDMVPVDVRTYNDAPVHAQFRALTGKLLVIRDADAFARVVEYVVPRYLDMEPLRRRAVQDVVSTGSAA